MRFWPSAERRLIGVAILGFATFVLALAWLPVRLAAGAAGNADFEIRHVHTRLVQGVYQVDASIELDFAAQTVEALQNGVPLTVLVEMEVLHVGRFWDDRVARVDVRYQLKLHALSGQYVVRNVNTGASHTYRALPEAIAALGTINGFPLVDESLIDASQHYRLGMRARLDIEALPSPMRLLAYLDSLWHPNSDWHYWPLKP